MRFESPLTALEFYINHRLGGGEPVSQAAICAAVDIERTLERFPAPLQRSLIEYAWNGTKNRFTDRTLRLLSYKLAEAGYMQPISDSAVLVAA